MCNIYIFKRIGFYVGLATHSLTWHINKFFFPKAHQKHLQMLEKLVTARIDYIEDEAKNTFDEHEQQRPALDPRRTMAFLSQPKEHHCNFITTSHYRKQIYKSLFWAKKHGVTCFVTDYTTPYGLLALETILKLKRDGTDITVYAAKSKLIKARKTYRLIKETPIELAILTSSADYSFSSLPPISLMEIFFNSGILASESGLWISRKKIPAYVLKAWDT